MFAYLADHDTAQLKCALAATVHTTLQQYVMCLSLHSGQLASPLLTSS